MLVGSGMKKLDKKNLTLTRETLRTLVGSDLARVVGGLAMTTGGGGGGGTKTCPSTPPSCPPTCPAGCSGNTEFSCVFSCN